MASSIKTSVKMIATLRVWCWISLKIWLYPEAFLCLKLGNCLFQIQGVSELLWCIKLSYFAENRWCPNINGVRKYMVNTVVGSESGVQKILVCRSKTDFWRAGPIFTSEGHQKSVHGNSCFQILDIKIYTLYGAITTNKPTWFMYPKSPCVTCSLWQWSLICVSQKSNCPFD